MTIELEPINQEIMSEELRYIYEEGRRKLNYIFESIKRDYTKRRNPIEHAKTRIKNNKSIIEKLQRKKITEITDEDITKNICDVIGGRIVCPFLSDIDNLKKILRDHPDIEIIDEKDYVNNPKESGYRSYHMKIFVKVVINNKIVKVKAEIQIRTILMDMWASLEHKIYYKKGIELSKETEKKITDLAEFTRIMDQELDRKKTDEIVKDSIYDTSLTEEEYERFTQKYQYAQNEVLNKINSLYTRYQNNENDLLEVNPIEDIEHRIKPLRSFARKIYNKKQEGKLIDVEKSINDIAGVRIVCSFKSDLLEIADTIENELGFEVIKELSKDYVTNPKENGYSGYHLIVAIPYYHKDGSMEKVKVEIQIRTIAMDMWAIVERNLRYKELLDDERQKQLSILANIREKIDNEMVEIIKESKELRKNSNKKRIKTPNNE